MKYDFKQLREARIERRWTQTELAEKAGLVVSTVSKVESGNYFWLKAIREMESVLGVSVIKTRKPRSVA